MRIRISLVALAFSALACSGATCAETAPAEESAPAPAPRAGTPRVDTIGADPLASEGAFAPSPTVLSGQVAMTWVEPASRGHRVRFARLADGGWEPPVTIVTSERMFANWADFPGVARSEDGSLVSHWLRRSGDDSPYAYDVVLVRSTDDGASWAELGKAHDDDTRSEHGFVSYVPVTGALRLFWLDGRATSGTAHDAPESERGAMALRTATVTGETIGPSELVDDRVCDCCQTAAVKTGDGALVAYRDRSEQEVRDIARARVTTGAPGTPGAVHEDGWEIRGCPVNGPALDADGRRVVAAWFTGSEPASVKVALSEDRGERFGTPAIVDAESPHGRVDVVIVDGGAVVSWLAAADAETAEIRLRAVDWRGRLGRPVSVATTSSERASGFPRIARVDDRLFVAWTDPSGLGRLRSSWVRVDDLPRP